ncbi:hypothetical protein GGX14DRAFT_568820 [Mycena pura]|uniref:DUF6534 domain-containing protein n=1 Tax=Mycena pura TaxID=153505 RepID=A0AAD6YEH0_9AGAR|nr:hypothetical protein GGX14DRAFT_568820 [Mycena pura]
MSLDIVTGPLLIGTWANSLLYTAELFEIKYYFSHFRNDEWKLKTLVIVAFLIDTVSTLGDYACVYLYTITHAGDPAYLADQHWPIPLYIFTTAVIAILVQSYLALRYWRFKNIAVTLIILFLIITAFGVICAIGVFIALFPAVKVRYKVEIAAGIWLVTEAVTDLSISAALLWEFRKARRNLIETQRPLNGALDRLVAVTIQTGTVTATIAVAALIAYLLKQESNIGVGFGFTLGRAYMLSMLANLNVRRSGKSPSSTGRSPGRMPMTFGTMSTDDPGTIRASFLLGLFRLRAEFVM